MPMANDHHNTLTDSLKRARFDLLPTYSTHRIELLRLFRETLALQQPILSRSWKQLEAQARLCMGLGYAEYRNLQSQLESTAQIDNLHHRLGSEFLFVLRGIAISGDRDQWVKNLKERLRNKDPAEHLNTLLAKAEELTGNKLSEQTLTRLRKKITGLDERLDLQKSMVVLANGKTKNIDLLKPFLPENETSMAVRVNSTANAVIMCLCRGLQGLVHAQFNIALKTDISSAEFSKQNIPTIKAITESFANQLTMGQKRIYSALLLSEPQRITQACLIFAGDIESQLPQFVGAQAVIHNAIEELLQRGSGGLAEKLGDLAVDAHFLTRSAIASHAACYRLAIGCRDFNTDKDIKALLKNIPSLAFSTPLPNGKDVELSRLENSSEGEFVEIRGFVEEVSSPPQEGGMLLSHLVLRDPSSNALANAVVRFAHLPHAGVCQGAFCRLSGTYREHSSLLDGKAAVEVDTLALAEIAESSFEICFLRLASRWFHPWRSNTNLYWSLGAHKTEEDSEATLGAGELLFTPLIRQ
ncbi:hypothetical protein [Microbulbifer variabilis]|uniref:hypothetical protein n=1 Tax=Microbulbifer variabilis TaxID=266805 RepID=UPI001CFEE214|nr:hypothetical protein [Microbulbifer variabilis]